MKGLILSLAVCLTAPQAWSIGCDGEVTEILTGNSYCANGERIGFKWSASSKWLCSSSRNMDTMLITAFASGLEISVRDSSWETCESPASKDIPDHIWYSKKS